MSHLHANMWRPNRDADERILFRKRSTPIVLNRLPHKGGGTMNGRAQSFESRHAHGRADKLLRKFSWEQDDG